MLLIAHRGNLEGPNPELENSPLYIQKALNEGFSVEIDLRMKDDELYLGHDYAQHKIGEFFLIQNKSKLWVHCKDYKAFSRAIQLNLNCFWHNTDDYTMTSYSYVWCYPNKPAISRSIAVIQEDINNIDSYKRYIGICSDYVLKIKSLINKV